MDELLEFRPEYKDIFGFLKSGVNISYTPIYLGFCLIMYYSIKVMCSRVGLSLKLLTLYFALSFFTNYAYQLAGLRFFDIVGLLITAKCCIDIAIRRSIAKDELFSAVLIIGVVLLTQIFVLVVIGHLSQFGNGVSTAIARSVMVSRIFVMAFVCYSFCQNVSTEDDVSYLINIFKYCGLATLAIMIIQAFMFLGLGIPTVGLNLATGNLPIPRFASTSIEGGHFGRLIPTFLVFFLPQDHGRRLYLNASFLIILAVSLTNISLSFYGFVVAILCAMFCFSFFIKRIGNLKVFVVVILAGVMLTGAAFITQVQQIYDKVVGLLLDKGEYSDIGNRSFGFVYKALSQFPLGLGFGGSDRFLPDGSYTDLGLYAYLSQTSIFGLGILAFMILCYFNLIRLYFIHRDRIALLRYSPQSFILYLALPVIFMLDIVWLYPGYILPVLIVYNYLRRL